MSEEEKDPNKNAIHQNTPFASLGMSRKLSFEDRAIIGRSRKVTKPNIKHPGVGVGIFLVDPVQNKLLIGKRLEGNLFGLPGGWLEKGEDWDECASRELKEETGLIKSKEHFKHVLTLNSFSLENDYHAISCCMYIEVTKEERRKIKNPEPAKCAGWFWATIEDLRKNYSKLFYPLRTFLSKFPEMKDITFVKTLIKN